MKSSFFVKFVLNPQNHIFFGQGCVAVSVGSSWHDLDHWLSLVMPLVGIVVCSGTSFNDLSEIRFFPLKCNIHITSKTTRIEATRMTNALFSAQSKKSCQLHVWHHKFMHPKYIKNDCTLWHLTSLTRNRNFFLLLCF